MSPDQAFLTGLGTLLSAGIPLDNILNMTEDQIWVSVEAVMLSKSELANAFLTPIMGVFGGELKPSKVSNGARRTNPEKADKDKLQELAAIGIDL